MPLAGVPERTPAELNERLAGSVDPDVRDQVYVPLPPVAWKAKLYATPTRAAGLSGDVLVIVNGAGLIVILKLPTAVCCELSVTDTWKVAGPLVGVAGVPDTTPAGLKVSPAGSDVPEPKVHV